jgi:hypothetical protein
MGWACGMYGDEENCIIYFGGTPEQNTWHTDAYIEDHSNTDAKEIVCECADCIDLAPDMIEQRAFVNTVMNIQVLLNAVNIFTIRRTICFQRRTPLDGISYHRTRTSVLPFCF